MHAFCVRLGSTVTVSARRGVKTRPGAIGQPSLLRQQPKPVAFAGPAGAASFAAADCSMRYRRGNESEYGKWNRVLDPPAQLRRMAAEGVRISPSMERALVTGLLNRI